MVGGNAKSAVLAGVICELVDTNGTPVAVELPAALDAGEWFQQLALNGTDYTAATTLDMQGQLTTTQPTTLAVICLAIDGTEEADLLAVVSQVNALQTTAND